MTDIAFLPHLYGKTERTLAAVNDPDKSWIDEDD